MRILHLISSVNPEGGGPIEGVKQIARIAEGAGSIVEVASMDDPSAPWLAAFPFKVHALGPPRLLSKSIHYAYAPNLIPWLQAHHKNYDAIIINGLWQYHGFAAWRVLHGSKTPYFVFTHGMLDPWFKRTYPFKHLKKWLYWPWAEYRVLRDAKAVLFTCEEERILARQSFWLYRCNEEVVGYGTSAPPGDAALQREIFLNDYPELRNKRLLFFISRIHPKKGCDLLIEAFSRVAKADPSLHLVMAGPDQIGWQAELEATSKLLGIAERITWTGMLSGDKKWGAYRAAVVFVLSSHQENFGIVVAEALACGLPALISKRVNIWREVEAEGAGIVANDDLDGTIGMLKEWLNMKPEDQQKMKQNALICFTKHFEISAAVKRLYSVLSR
ncbi:glycosyl transferase group 1 [Sulfuricella denitrificans skB26]|uniref:Glycosyl transferase group 1 n=1 Tax=Sulfuricella denitrificans (strain DSM 22764 / NBRC 105220 / skB26) TaxID=1163617 RepID=S6AGM5_SULDS|nr:glycosyltransferase [Sulfuricella denitrificans]BAN35171.1 glycosyl transferase group 1 [Sulfuricella denitrificans skB26]